MSRIIESAIVVLAFCFICLYGMKLQKNGSEEKYLSKEVTTNFRGLLAVGIVLHHASGYYTELSFVSPFRFVGYLIVGLFFFLSGYGLQYGFENKKGYMSGFLKNRLSSILVPYWTATTLDNILLSALGEVFSVKAYVLSLLLVKLSNGTMWYIQVLILLYIVYWISHVNNENTQMFWIAFFVLFFTLFCSNTQDDLYYRSIFAFPLGVYWYKYRSKILKILDHAYIRYLVFGTVGLGICLCVKLLGAKLSSSMVTSIGSMSSAVMICVCFGILFYKLYVDNNILRFLGNLSFEIYLVHDWILRITWKFVYEQDSLLLFMTASLGITIILAMILNRINKTVLAGFRRHS